MIYHRPKIEFPCTNCVGIYFPGMPVSLDQPFDMEKWIFDPFWKCLISSKHSSSLWLKLWRSQLLMTRFTSKFSPKFFPEHSPINFFPQYFAIVPTFQSLTRFMSREFVLHTLVRFGPIFWYISMETAESVPEPGRLQTLASMYSSLHSEKT